RGTILAALERIASATAIARADVQITILWTEGEISAVMVLILVMIDVEDHRFAGCVGEVGIRRDLESRDGQVAAGGGVVDVKMLLVRNPRRERQPQQAALAAAVHAGGYVEERSRKRLAAADDANASGLLDHKQPAAAVSGMRDRDWVRESARDQNGPD